MTMLRQIRSTGPMRAPCFRGLSLGHFMLNVYWVLFLCVPTSTVLGRPCSSSRASFAMPGFIAHLKAQVQKRRIPLVSHVTFTEQEKDAPLGESPLIRPPVSRDI